MTGTTQADRSPSGRATSLKAFFALLESMNSKEGVARGLSLQLSDSDVVIAPFGKSGTTWLQQIAHTLRTRGDMDFDDISRAVAEFMGIPLDDELFTITADHASLSFMQKHKDRFDDKLMRDRSIAVAGLSPDVDSAKVRSGQVGESREKLAPEVVAELDEIWHEQITKELGFENYAAMIAALR